MPATSRGAYLALLADRGVDYLFGNAGTDFAAAHRSLCAGGADGRRRSATDPRDARESRRLDGARLRHGVAADTAVMVHVSVGTANMICAAMNAARENVALLLTAGRSPLTETGLVGIA